MWGGAKQAVLVLSSGRKHHISDRACAPLIVMLRTLLALAGSKLAYSFILPSLLGQEAQPHALHY